jgi:hypothetical protein
MMTFEVTVFDEVDGRTDVLTVRASSLDSAIDKVEGDPNHEYEIVEIERA